MKKRINLRLILIGTISIILTSVVIILIFYNLFQTRVQEDLKLDGYLLKQTYSKLTGTEDLKNINTNQLRITLISQDGTVLYESDTDAEQMENHLDRPEIVQALQNGEGETVRTSDTLDVNTYYFAIKLDDGNILRVARQANSMMAIFLRAMLPIVILLVIIFILCLILSHFLTKAIVRPIDKVADNMSNIDNIQIYDELIPFARTIKKQNERISNQIETLEEEKNKIQTITENMSEGLLMLDINKNILMANLSAISMLSANNDNYLGKNIIYFSRNEQLSECIDKAITGNARTEDIVLNARQLQIIASPVYNNNDIIGVICLILDVTEKKEIERLRREFTANVSHELKTPLTSISGYAELIENGMAKEEDIKSFASKIHRESVRLLTLISDIIKLSELDEDNKSSIGFEKVDLYDIASECIESLSIAAEKGNINMKLTGSHCIINANYGMMEELMFNLCDNAIRYNKKGGSVLVNIQNTDNNIILSVKDTGIGIPEEHKERIFERFYRVDKSRSKETGGTGLGLAIVKHISQQHHAKIELKSQEGIGTEISIIFPISSQK